MQGEPEFLARKRYVALQSTVDRIERLLWQGYRAGQISQIEDVYVSDVFDIRNRLLERL